VATVRERQRWLAVLALLVAVPLPLTGIVSWPFLLPFLTVALACLLARRVIAPLPVWLENVLAPVIVLAVVVSAGGVRYGLLRPLTQLVVLLATVRMPGCGARARCARTAAILSLIGVAGIASSTHPVLALYLLLLLVFALLAIGRASYLAWREEGMRIDERAVWPPARLVTATTLLALLVAAPLFALLPRLRSPFSVAVGFPPRGLSGFRDAVALHALGEIKSSRQLALRIAFPDATRFSPDWLRLAGTTLTHYRAGAWVQGRLQDELVSGRGRRNVALVAGASESGLERGEIVLEKAADTLFVPVGTRALELPLDVPVRREPTGGLRIPRDTEPPVAYAVLFGIGIPEQRAPTAADLELPGDAAALEALARSASVGTTNTLAAALALEDHLRRSYRYTLRTWAPLREDPVEWFLFRAREGHCEFFASSMVLLLRALAIPARLQAGYIGGEPDGRGGYLVRDNNAHAWVLAWVAGRPAPGGAGAPKGEWRVFDPTPPEGVPRVGGGPQSGGLATLWPRFEAAWDRWILTFGLSDQAELLRRALEVAVAKGVVVLRALPACVAVALGIWLLCSSWRARRARRRNHGLPPVGRAMAAVLDAAVGAGLIAAVGITPRALLRASRLAGEPQQTLAWLVQAHERARYAQAEAPPRGELRHAVRALEQALNAARGRTARGGPRSFKQPG
jgi:transglutaminase-like putative cysteine protease